MSLCMDAMEAKQSEAADVGFVKVVPIGLIDPALPQRIGRGATGVVEADGAVEVEGIEGQQFQLADSDTIDEGTKVHLTLRRRDIYAKPLDEHQAEKRRQKRTLQQKRKASARAKWRRRKQAEAFWDQYELPFEFDVAIKGRRSGLMHGSAGTGRNVQTVEHLFVQSPFHSGQLVRDADTYLCQNDANLTFDEERHKDGYGGEYMPAVTCAECLDRMERWKTGGAQ